MSNLNSLFDIYRGWPNASGLSYDFKQKDAVTPNIAEGTVVAVEVGAVPGQPVVDRHESGLIGTNYDQPWLVIQGADQYDGQFTGKMTCLKLRTGIVFKVPTVLTPTVGALVWSDSDGVFTITDPGGGVPHIGKVLEFNADEGYMVIES